MDCCKYCKAPKRHPGCHDTCPDYILAKAKHNELKDKIYHTKHNTYDIAETVVRLNKEKRKKRHWYK